MNVGLFGFGAHGRDIYEQWNRCHKLDKLRIFDENPDLGHALRPPEGLPCFIGINHPAERRRAAQRLRIAPAPPLIDPSANVGHDCEVGGGAVVAAGALLLHDVVIGKHSHINYLASMTRTWLGDFVTVCPGVTICGDVEIGDECLIGAGAVICNLVTIGSGVTIGAGAVVAPGISIPDGATMLGLPAKPHPGATSLPWRREARR